MKRLTTAIILACACMMMSFTLNPTADISTKHPDAVQWKKTTVEVGEVPQGKPVTVEFEFTNTGNENVIIANAQTTCGCTVSDYPKEVIKPGAGAKVTATYNAAVKGIFSKTVNVTLQSGEATVLYMKGTVI